MAGTPLDWDSEISNDGQDRTVLPKGPANFRILKLEKKTSAKKKCPQAVLTIEVFNAAGKTTCLDFIDLHTDSEWKICQLFRAIGQRKHGETIVPKWNQVENSTGKCEIDIRPFKKKGDPDNESEWTGRGNEITKYIDNDAPPAPAPAQTAPRKYQF